MSAPFTIGTVDLSMYPVGDSRKRELFQPSEKSAGGVRYGYDSLDVADTITLDVEVTDAERTALEGAFASDAYGSMLVIALADHIAGTSVNVRFDTPVLKFEAIGNNFWRSSMTFLVYP